MPWFDEECLYFLDQRKQAKMQWVQNPSQSNVANPNIVRREGTRHFRNKKAYQKAKIEDLETNISDFKKGYEPRTNVAKDEKGDLVAGSYSIVAMWRNYFFQLRNVHGINDIKHTDIHIKEPPVAEPSAFKVELATEKLKSHKSPGTDQIPAN